MAAEEQSTSKNVSAYVIDEDTSIIDALEKFDENGIGVLFVQRDDRLVAAISDGDVRRHILRNGDLKAAVSVAANYHPTAISKDHVKDARNFLLVHSFDGVPIVDDENHIIDIVLLKDFQDASEKLANLDAPVVIMAGGKGTRLYPYTKILPKPLIPIGEIPIAEHIVNRFRSFGCNRFCMIVNYKKNMIKAYFNELDKDYSVKFADEEKPLGTGGGLSLLSGKINETFFLTNCDILIQENLERIYRFHKENKNKITMVCSLKNFKIPYGVIKLNETGSIASMTEKPHVPFLTNTGCYVVEPEVIDSIPKDTPMGFPDIVQHYQDIGENVGVFPIAEGAWLDMGVPDEMERMKERLGIS